MTPEQWNALITAIAATRHAVEITAATTIPLFYVYFFIIRREAIMSRLRHSEPAPTPADREPVPVRVSARAEVRQLDPAEPTAVMRGLNGATSIYRTGPRPLVSELRLRFAGLKVVRERRVTMPALRPRARQPRRVGRHRRDDD